MSMIAKVSYSITAILIIFLAYVSTREGKFRYERSGVIDAPADKIFPYISNLKMGHLWSPYEKKDPDMKKTFSGTEGAVGSIMEFEGNKDVGSGTLEILKIVPNELVHIKLHMKKPFDGENLIEYILTPDGTGTRFSWAMAGDGGYITKLMTLFIDCEKMVAGDFSIGIENLKQVVESQK